jgi:excisionase family DNA binding protein
MTNDVAPVAVAPILVNVAEAARLLSISRSYAYELVASKQLASIRLGRRVLIPVAAIRELVTLGGTEDPEEGS